MNIEAVISAKLSLQRALLGYVLNNVRVVAFALEEQSLHIRFYIDGEVSEDNLESSSCVETEVIADYETEYKITAECLRLDYPSVIENWGFWVFQRQEPYI